MPWNSCLMPMPPKVIRAIRSFPYSSTTTVVKPLALLTLTAWT